MSGEMYVDLNLVMVREILQALRQHKRALMAKLHRLESRWEPLTEAEVVLRDRSIGKLRESIYWTQEAIKEYVAIYEAENDGQ